MVLHIDISFVCWRCLIPYWILVTMMMPCHGNAFRVTSTLRGESTVRWWTKGPWWRHQMETFSALLAICAGNSPVPGEFPTQWPVTRSFDVYFDLRPDKRLSKQPWGWWFETPVWSLWRHRNAVMLTLDIIASIYSIFWHCHPNNTF